MDHLVTDLNDITEALAERLQRGIYSERPEVIDTAIARATEQLERLRQQAQKTRLLACEVRRTFSAT